MHCSLWSWFKDPIAIAVIAVSAVVVSTLGEVGHHAPTSGRAKVEVVGEPLSGDAGPLARSVPPCNALHPNRAGITIGAGEGLGGAMNCTLNP